MGQLSRALKDEWKFTKRKGVQSSDVPSSGGIKGQLSVSGKLDEWGKAGDAAEAGGDCKLKGIGCITQRPDILFKAPGI